MDYLGSVLTSTECVNPKQQFMISITIYNGNSFFWCDFFFFLVYLLVTVNLMPKTYCLISFLLQVGTNAKSLTAFSKEKLINSIKQNKKTYKRVSLIKKIDKLNARSS